jgi:hypothetical protein
MSASLSEPADHVPSKKSKKRKLNGQEVHRSAKKAKKSTPNQRYQTMATQYLSCPGKLAMLDEYLKSLPVDTADLSGTHYANIDS